MEKSLEQGIEMIFNDDVKNIELISYFKRSTKKTSVFLGDINRKYAEIRPLIDRGLIIDQKAVTNRKHNSRRRMPGLRRKAKCLP